MTRHRNPAQPRIGLALSGGGARGFAHIPVLEALDDLGVKPTLIAGASMGAVIAAGYAAGMSGREIRDYAMATFRNTPDVLGRLWKLRPRSMREIVSGVAAVGQLDAERVLNAFMPDHLPRSFNRLAIPLRIIATDFYGRCEVVLDKGDLFQAVAASSAIPILFRPVTIGDRFMVDGGISNPLPFDHVAGDCDIVIAVDVVGGPINGKGRAPGPAETIFGATQLFMQAIIREKLRALPPPDVLVRPQTDGFRFVDFMNAGAIIKSSETTLDEVKQQLDRAISGFARSRR